MFLLVMAFIGIAAFNSQTNLLFWTFGLMAGVLFVSVILSWLMTRNLRIKRLLPDHGVVDEPLSIRYELNNRGWFMPCFGMAVMEVDGWKKGKMRGRPMGWVMHLGARAIVQAEATGYALKRGAIDFQRVRVVTGFPFGIIRRSVTFPIPGRLVVYPKLCRLRRDLLWDIRAHEPMGTRRSSDGGGNEEFYGLREYRSGDSIKFIDWKHSARISRLVSRDMTRLTPPKLMVVLDLNRKNWSDEESAERAISFAASLICEAHLEGFEVGIAVEGVPFTMFPPHHSRWHRTRMLHSLGELNPLAKGHSPWSPASVVGAHWVVIHAGDPNPALGPGGSMRLTHRDYEYWQLKIGTQVQQYHPDSKAPAEEEVAAWA